VFGTAQEFLSSLEADAPACLVLDVRMPGLGGLDCQRRLAEAGLHLPVIFMRGYGDVPTTVLVMKAGAIDFLTKPFRDQDLLDAVTHALERDRVRRADESDNARLRESFGPLMPREREVMTWVVTGRPNKQIAGALGTTERSKCIAAT
jgi:FixJ family two-component response regulator